MRLRTEGQANKELRFSPAGRLPRSPTLDKLSGMSVQFTSPGKMFDNLTNLNVTSPLHNLITGEISCYSYTLERPLTGIERRVVGYMFYVQMRSFRNTRIIQCRLNSFELCGNGNFECSNSYDFEVGCHSLTEIW